MKNITITPKYDFKNIKTGKILKKPSKTGNNIENTKSIKHMKKIKKTWKNIKSYKNTKTVRRKGKENPRLTTRSPRSAIRPQTPYNDGLTLSFCFCSSIRIRISPRQLGFYRSGAMCMQVGY